MRTARLLLVGSITAPLLLVGCTATADAGADASPSADTVSPSPAEVTGTSKPGPASSPSPAPSGPGSSNPPAGPLATPAHDLGSVDRIELDAERMVFLAGSRTVTTGSLFDVDSLVSPLTAVLGDPQVVETPLSDCSPPSTDYLWSGGPKVVDYHEEERGGPWHLADVHVLIDTPNTTSASGSPVSLEGPSGISVGGELTTLLSSSGDDVKDEFLLEGGSDWLLLLQEGYAGPVGEMNAEFPAASGQPLKAGVVARTDATIVQFVESPVLVNEEGEC